MNKFLLALIALFYGTAALQAQVGIGTTDPKNDLHIEGGLRITDTPPGEDNDASQRVLASDENGDVVTVDRDQILKDVKFPEIIFSAKYGTTNPFVPFFDSCDGCSAGQQLRLNLVSPKIAYQKTSAIQVVNPSGTNGDEYFRITEDGYYTFEIQTSITLNQAKKYYINFYMENRKADGSTETDILRIYAGIPAGGEPDNQNIGAPITFKDVKYYNAGDEVYFAFQPAFNINAIIANGRPTGASYAAQLTVMRFTD